MEYIKWLNKVEENNNLDSRKEELPAIKNARRSIVAKTQIKKGSILNEDNLTTKRPGYGIPASKWDLVKGKFTKIEIKEDTMIEWEMIT